MECGCGRWHVADAPPDVAGEPGTVSYGLGFQTWCVFLMVMHHVPVERCADIIESMSGVRPSGGRVHADCGFASTAAKHGHDIFTVLRGALAGNCWVPPIPADA